MGDEGAHLSDLAKLEAARPDGFVVLRPNLIDPEVLASNSPPGDHVHRYGEMAVMTLDSFTNSSRVCPDLA